MGASVLTKAQQLELQELEKKAMAEMKERNATYASAIDGASSGTIWVTLEPLFETLEQDGRHCGFDLGCLRDAGTLGTVCNAPESTRATARGSVKRHDEVSGKLERVGLHHRCGRGFFGSGAACICRIVSTSSCRNSTDAVSHIFVGRALRARSAFLSFASACLSRFWVTCIDSSRGAWLVAGVSALNTEPER